MITQIPITEARKTLNILSNRLEKEKETIEVTKRGKPVMVILPWIVYESLVETMEIMGDAELMGKLKESLTDIKEGRTIPWEEAKAELNR